MCVRTLSEVSQTTKLLVLAELEERSFGLKRPWSDFGYPYARTEMNEDPILQPQVFPSITPRRIARVLRGKSVVHVKACGAEVTHLSGKLFQHTDDAEQRHGTPGAVLPDEFRYVELAVLFPSPQELFLRVVSKLTAFLVTTATGLSGLKMTAEHVVAAEFSMVYTFSYSDPHVGAHRLNSENIFRACMLYACVPKVILAKF